MKRLAALAAVAVLIAAALRSGRVVRWVDRQTPGDEQ